MTEPKTLSEKVWDAHLVSRTPGEPDLLFIDLHLVHEVTSPQAFDGLRLAGRGVRHPELTLATEDHNVPTADTHLEIADPISRKQVQTLRDNCAEFGITLHPMNTPGQTEPVESLGTGHLVHEVQVDEQQVGLAVGLTDDVCVPDLLTQGPAHASCLLLNGCDRSRHGSPKQLRGRLHYDLEYQDLRR